MDEALEALLPSMSVKGRYYCDVDEALWPDPAVQQNMLPNYCFLCFCCSVFFLLLCSGLFFVSLVCLLCLCCPDLSINSFTSMFVYLQIFP